PHEKGNPMIGIRDLYRASDRTLARTPRPLRDAALRLVAPATGLMSCPRVLMVEPTNACNGKCPLCPVGARTMDRDVGMLDPGLLARVIDEVGPRVRMVIMNFAGEPFLHPRLPDLVRIARGHGAQVLVGTNGTRDRASDILDAEPTEILFSLDGTTPATYEQYRNYRDGTTLSDVKTNLERLVDEKRRRSASTRIVLQFVVFRHNESEIDDVVDYAERVGVDAVDLKPACVNDYFDEDVSALKDRYLPTSSAIRQYRDDQNGQAQLRPGFCSFAFNETQLAWNGDLISCCFDTDGANVLGNVERDGGLLQVWNGDRGRSMQRKILRQGLDLCDQCGVTSVRSTRVDLRSKRPLPPTSAPPST
ncbi:MAG TPA: radical SAM/SPASM domain-containing protein, partial [Candidatus Krumholzibacteria bacterium]|nr:radical SAM/SPASM domain-containing protein [Candidatus Krumholzibacteria bacterium]